MKKTKKINTNKILFIAITLAVVTLFIAILANAGAITGKHTYGINPPDEYGAAVELTGACCYPDGGCEITDQVFCGTDGGLYQGDDVPCDPNPCPQPAIGACCYSGGCFEDNIVDCNDMFGEYQGDGTSCDELGICDEPFEEYVDLRVTKIGKPDGEVRAGDDLEYTIIVDNLGPIPARNVAIKDIILADECDGCDFVIETIVSDRVCSCWAGNGIVMNTEGGSVMQSSVEGKLEFDCLLEEPEFLPPLSITEPVTSGSNPGRWVLKILVTAEETIDINNFVTVLSDELEYDFSNNVYMTEHEVTDVADVAIYRTSECGPKYTNKEDVDEWDQCIQEPVTAGEILMYSVRVHNFGPSTATNIYVYDHMPAEVEIMQIVSSDGECNAGTPGDPTDPTFCVIDELDDGESETMMVVVKVKEDLESNPLLPDNRPSPLLNDAWVKAEEYDSDMSNNYYSHKQEVLAFADLEIIKDAPVEPVKAGEETFYNVNIGNNGPSTARNVIVRDNLPEKAEFVEALPTQGDCMYNEFDHTLICRLGDMEVEKKADIFIKIKAKADISEGFILTNEALVVSDTEDTFPGNDEALAETEVAASADVYLINELLTEEVVAGGQVKYKITIGNNGPSDAENVNVQDFLPFVFDGGPIYPFEFIRCEPVDIDDFAMCSYDNGVVTVDLLLKTNEQIIPGDLAAGEEYSFIVVAEVDSGYLLNEFVNDDYVGDSYGAKTTNNARRNSNVLNQYSAADLTPYDHPFLATNDARITTITQDMITANNVDAVDTEIYSKADLQIEKDYSGVQWPLLPGDTIGYILTITNNGPSDAAAVYVTDWLPDEVIRDPAHVSVSVSDGTVFEIRPDGRILVLAGNSPDNNMVNQLGRLNSGESVTVEILATVKSTIELDSKIKNRAFVETRKDTSYTWTYDAQTPTPDSNEENNEAELLTPIGPLQDIADISVEKYSRPNPVAPGGLITYEIIIENFGPAVAKGITLFDQLPGELTVTSIDIAGGKGHCTTNLPGEIRCELGDLAPGTGMPSELITIYVTAQVSPSATGIITNMVDVLMKTIDTDMGNNNVIEETTILGLS